MLLFRCIRATFGTRELIPFTVQSKFRSHVVYRHTWYIEANVDSVKYELLMS